MFFPIFAFYYIWYLILKIKTPLIRFYEIAEVNSAGTLM